MISTGCSFTVSTRLHMWKGVDHVVSMSVLEARWFEPGPPTMVLCPHCVSLVRCITGITGAVSLDKNPQFHRLVFLHPDVQICCVLR